MDSNTRGSNEAQEGEESRQESDDGIDEYQQTDDSTEGTDEPSSQDEEESDDEDIAPMMPSPEVNPGAAFRWILEYRVGLTTKNQIRSVTRVAGVKRVEQLRFMTEEVLVETLDPSTTGISRLRLMALRRFSQDQWNNFGRVDLNQFNRKKMDEILEELAKGTKRDRDSKPRSSSGPKDSDLKRFSGKPEHWQEAKTSLITHLNTMRNDNGIPLYYVIRDPEDEERYRENTIGAKIYDALQTGKAFEDDSFQVAQVLK